MDVINYNELNARQQESFNFQKVPAVLADFGYFTMKFRMIGKVQIL